MSNTCRRWCVLLVGSLCLLAGGASLTYAQSPGVIQATSSQTEQPCLLCSMDKNLSRLQKSYKTPQVTLRDQDNREVKLADLIQTHRGQVVLQFAFTSCTTLCPVMTGAFSGARNKLDDADAEVLYLTISIDPRFDTPARLNEYSEPLGRDDTWHFLTGSVDDVIAVQKAFDAYPGSKSRHEALTFLLPAGKQSWTRITGVMSAATLEKEIRELLKVEPTADQASIEIGRSIYEEGILPNGQLLKATVAGDIPVHGRNAACAKCHRKSGYGSDEPGKLVPPIVEPVLFSELLHRRSWEYRALYQEPQTPLERSAVRARSTRPAYTTALLATALRTGTTPGGETLSLLQPRYNLSDSDLTHLESYLRSLGDRSDEGVDDDFMHFAVVYDTKGESQFEETEREIIDHYVALRNREVLRFRIRPGISPLFKSEMIPSYRQWKIHYWSLDGNDEQRWNQLNAKYDTSPVFAFLLGGGNDSFRTVSRFCNQRKIPWLFPSTHVTVPEQEQPGYTIRFQNGIASPLFEFQQFVAERPHLLNSKVLLDGSVHSFEIADWVKKTLNERFTSDSEIHPEVKRYESESALSKVLDKATLDDCYAICYGTMTSDLAGVINQACRRDVTVLLIPSAVSRLESELLDQSGVSPNAYVCLPTAAHSQPHMERQRNLGWFRARRIDISKCPDHSLNTLFVLNLVHHAAGMMVDRYSREYLIERVEHEAESAPNPGVFSHISLGPNQRIAAPACEFVRQKDLHVLMAR